ncbi:MAG: STAS domain-containing protein [Spirochaetota bacterium]
MELNFKKVENAIIIYFRGRLDVHHSLDIEEELSRLITMEPASHFIINMKDVEYISSSGLRVLVMSMKALKKDNRMMLICCINEAVRKVFEIVQFTDILKIYESEQKALEYISTF